MGVPQSASEPGPGDGAAEGRRQYLKELFANQVWQGANFVAKAAFLVALTPLMLSRWGAEQYGLFALASSLLVSMALLDGGVRNLTRLRMVEALRAGDEEGYRRSFAEGVFTFGAVVALAVVGLAGLGAAGLLERSPFVGRSSRRCRRSGFCGRKRGSFWSAGGMGRCDWWMRKAGKRRCSRRLRMGRAGWSICWRGRRVGFFAFSEGVRWIAWLGVGAGRWWSR